jgi:hypothetical protein
MTGAVAAREDRQRTRGWAGSSQGRAVLQVRANQQWRPTSSPSAGSPPLSTGGPAAAIGVLMRGSGRRPTLTTGERSSSTSVGGGSMRAQCVAACDVRVE